MSERDYQAFVQMSPDGGMTWGEPRAVMLDSSDGIIRLYAFGTASNVQFKITCSTKQMLNVHRITLLYDVARR